MFCVRGGERMKIIAFCLDSSNYSALTHEILVVEELVKMGNEVTIVGVKLPFGYNTKIPPNIKCYIMDLHTKITEEQIDLLLSEKYDVAFSSSFPGAGYINYIAKEQNIKSVCQVLDVPIFRLRFKQWYDEWIYTVNTLKNTDIIISNIKITSYLLNQLSNNELNDKIKNIYYGIDIDKIDGITIEKKEDYIVWVSRITWYKGLEILLYALACMENPPRLKVIGVGDGTEQDMGGVPFRLVQLASHLNLKVEFLGGLTDDEKFKVIKKAKLGVMPDISQSIATMFVLESIYCGTPCITTDLPVCRDRYEDTALYVKDIYNTRAWANAIQQCLDNIDQLTENTQIHKKWIMEQRSFKSQAKELMKIFEECVGDTNGN